MTNLLTMGKNKIRLSLTKLKEYVHHNDKLNKGHVEKYNPQQTSYEEQQNRMVLLQAHPSSPNLHPNRNIEDTTYFEIGVGVYQGEVLALRQLVSETPSHPHWVVYRLLPDDFGLISSQTIEQLCQLVSYVRCSQLSCSQSNGLKKKCGIKLPPNCPEQVLFGYNQQPYGVGKTAAVSHKLQCPLKIKILESLEQAQQCPFDDIVDDSK